MLRLGGITISLNWQQFISALIYAEETAGRVEDKDRRLDKGERFLYRLKPGRKFE